MTDRRQLLFELDVFYLTCIGTEHPRREACETERQVQRVANRQTGRDFELFQVNHCRAAVEAHADILVANASGVAGRAGQPDLVGFGKARPGIRGAGQPRETDRQAVEILHRGRP